MYALLLILLLTRALRVAPQCYNNTDCSGAIIPLEVDGLRTCCVDTNDGLSYDSGTTCNLCVGMYYVMIIIVSPCTDGVCLYVSSSWV